jgi:hypothetical protein
MAFTSPRIAVIDGITFFNVSRTADLILIAATRSSTDCADIQFKISREEIIKRGITILIFFIF